MLGVFYAAIPVGSALGYIVGGVVGEASGWRAAFFIAGAPGAVLAFLLLLLTEPRRGAMDPPGAASPVPLGLRASVAALVRRRSYLVNTLALFIKLHKNRPLAIGYFCQTIHLLRCYGTHFSEYCLRSLIVFI